jgi:Flp pilus assembly protein TadD
MRTMKILPVVGMATLLMGCYEPVHSLFPLYTDEDEVFEPALLGLWMSGGGSDSTASLILENGETHGYKFVLRGTEDDTWLTREFEMHLVQLGEYRFVDLLLTRIQNLDMDDIDAVPSHLIGRLTLEADTLQFLMLDGDWVSGHLPKQHWVQAEEPVLTAPTEELQKIALEYAQDEAAFARGLTLPRLTLDDKLAFLRRTVAESPGDQCIVCELFWAELHSGRSDDALTLALENVRLQPTVASAHYRAGIAWLMKDDWDGAREEFDIAVRLEPENFAAIHYRGLMDFLQRRYPEAEADFAMAYELDRESNTHVTYVSFLAMARRQLGRSTEAEEVLHGYIHRDNIFPWSTYLVEYQLGQESEQDLLDFIHGSDWRCLVYFYIGYAALLDGESPKAREFLQRTVDTQEMGLPEFHAARGLLAQLGRK